MATVGPPAFRGRAMNEPAQEGVHIDVPAIMFESRRYAKAPIVEASVDIRCNYSAAPSADALQGVRAGEFIYDLQVNVSPIEPTGDVSSILVGVQARVGDTPGIVRNTTSGFSYSRIGAYDRWDTFIAGALREWDSYRLGLRPERLTRVGVRFINRIRLPFPQVEIKDYLRVHIDVPSYLPQLVAQYLLRVEVPLPDRFAGVYATVTSTLDPGSTGSALILDVDTWKEVDLTGDEGDIDATGKLLGTLRNAKNYVFEACITDATRGLIS